MAPNVIGRPLLYITLPSIAFVLSFLWLRRKKPTVVHCDTGGSQNSPEGKAVEAPIQTQAAIVEELANHRVLNHSKSVPIATGKGGIIETNQSGDINKFGKSAPINIPIIAGNGLGSGLNVVAVKPDIIIDPELLNLKIKDSEFKTLRSIEEDEDDLESELSLDLPESLPDQRRRLFAFDANERANRVEPIVVKATMAAKISPENSFVETKYTEECSDEVAEDNTTNKASQSQQSRKFEAKSELSEMLAASDDDKEATNRTVAPVASPPLSMCSLHSSADSGKGSSPPQSVCTPNIVYEFLLPQNLVGQLIGRKGSYVQALKNKTGVNVLVKRHPDSAYKIKVCSLEGAPADVDAALSLIRQKLPEKQYPNVTLSRVFTGKQDISPDQTVPFSNIDSPCIQLNLIEGINNDVWISSFMSAGHLFVQQPFHPSFPSLATLQSCMNQIYSLTESPPMPEIMESAMCVACVSGNWYRVLIVEQMPKTDDTTMCLVRFLDFGGFCEVDSRSLRQIRSDCMTVPFQGIECVLADVRPPKGQVEWSQQANDIVATLTQQDVLQAQVVGYTVDGIPEVFLFSSHSDNIVFINKELVAQGLAELTEESSIQIA